MTQYVANNSADEKDPKKKNQAGVGAYLSEEENDLSNQDDMNQLKPSTVNQTSNN